MPTGYPKDGRPRKRKLNATCVVCHHAERHRIEALHIAGLTLDKLAGRFGVSRDAIWRHMKRHMTEERRASYLVGAARIAELSEVAAEESQSVLDYLGVLRSTLVGQLDRLAQKNDAAGVVAVSRPLLRCLTAIGKVTGEINTLSSQTIVNVHNNSLILNSPPFADLQSGLIDICERHPDARADILSLFASLDAKYAPRPFPAPRVIESSEAAHG